MQCPVDGATLTMSERSGIEIDYCPTCRGVWLDRGELDKIIDRAAPEAPAAPAPQAAAPPPQQQPQQPAPQYQQPGYQQPVAHGAPAPYMQYSGKRGYGGHGGHGGQYGHRKKNWLSEIFD